MGKVINSVAELYVTMLNHQRNGGQFAVFHYTKKVEFNVMPSEAYCKAHNITLASGKGSRKANEPYRCLFSNEVQSLNSVKINYNADYDNALAKNGGERSANGKTYEVKHYGNIPLVWIVDTSHYAIEYIRKDKDCDSLGYLLNGEVVTEPKVVDYIRGYKRHYNYPTQLVAYRNLGLENLKEIHIDHEVYEVKITNAYLSEEEFMAEVTALATAQA